MMRLKQNPRVEYRIATAQDATDFYGKVPAYSFRGLAFFVDGKIAGIAGYKIDSGRFVIFSDIAEGVTVNKQTIFRCAKIVMDFVSGKKCPMIAGTDNPRFCESLGMKHLSGDTYTWN